MRQFKLFFVLFLCVFASCEKEQLFDNEALCSDGTCEDIRTYIIRGTARGEDVAIRQGEYKDENGYYHYSMNIDSQWGHTTSDTSDDLGKRIVIQSFIDDGYIGWMQPGAPNYSRPFINASYKSNYWYTIHGGVFVGNRYDIFSSTNGQTRIPTSNSTVRTAHVEEQINAVQGGVRWFATAGRGPQWTTQASVYLSSRFIGDTITVGALFRVGEGKNPVEVYQEVNIIVEP